MLKKVEMLRYLDFDDQKCIYGIEASGSCKDNIKAIPLSLVKAIVPTITNVDKMKSRLAIYEIDNIEFIRKLAYIKGSNIHAPFNIKNICNSCYRNINQNEYVVQSKNEFCICLHCVDARTKDNQSELFVGQKDIKSVSDLCEQGVYKAYPENCFTHTLYKNKLKLVLDGKPLTKEDLRREQDKKSQAWADNIKKKVERSHASSLISLIATILVNRILGA